MREADARLRAGYEAESQRHQQQKLREQEQQKAEETRLQKLEEERTRRRNQMEELERQGIRRKEALEKEKARLQEEDRLQEEARRRKQQQDAEARQRERQAQEARQREEAQQKEEALPRKSQTNGRPSASEPWTPKRMGEYQARLTEFTKTSFGPENKLTFNAVPWPVLRSAEVLKVDNTAAVKAVRDFFAKAEDILKDPREYRKFLNTCYLAFHSDKWSRRSNSAAETELTMIKQLTT